MEDYMDVLIRREAGELTLFERFDDWIRGRNKPPVSSINKKHLDLFESKSNGTYEKTTLDKLVDNIGYFYELRLPSLSEDYYLAIAQNRLSFNTGFMYKTFKNLIDLVFWVPDNVARLIDSLNNKLYIHILEYKVSQREGE